MHKSIKSVAKFIFLSYPIFPSFLDKSQSRLLLFYLQRKDNSHRHKALSPFFEKTHVLSYFSLSKRGKWSSYLELHTGLYIYKVLPLRVTAT